jgi:hypothetical protein
VNVNVINPTIPYVRPLVVDPYPLIGSSVIPAYNYLLTRGSSFYR